MCKRNNPFKETTHILVVYSPGTKYEVRERLPIDNFIDTVNKRLDNILKQRIKDGQNNI